jgi:hypothetical protein
MTCGFGAVVLFFMVINASVGLRSDRMTADLQADANRLDYEVLDGHEKLVELRNSLQDTVNRTVVAQGLSRRLIEEIEALQVELARHENLSLAQQEHLNKLMADLKSLEEGTRRLAASAVTAGDSGGDQIRTVIGDGTRQYLTGLKVGGDRILILVDTSASMLGSTLVNVIRRRNLPDRQKIQAGKWRQTVATVDWLTAQMPEDSQFQIYTFNESVESLIPDTKGTWLRASDPGSLDEAVERLRITPPQKGTNLYKAFDSVATLQPKPDNIVLLVDGLPTMGRNPPKSNTISAKQRLKLFNRAFDQLPKSIPVNVILFPMEGDPEASSAFWRLALATRGSFLSPSDDWP